MDKQAAGSQGSRPQSYTEEYKRQVVNLLVSTGRTATSVAAEVGIHHTLLSHWVRQYGQAEGMAPPPTAPRPAASSLKPLSVLHADQAAKIAQLWRENERLRMESDILKKGILIFAVPSP